jgi:hypothetical protein
VDARTKSGQDYWIEAGADCRHGDAVGTAPPQRDIEGLLGAPHGLAQTHADRFRADLLGIQN